MIFHDDIIQGSDEWKILRCTRFTASTMGALFMTPSTAGYNDAINNIVYGRLTGNSNESFTSYWMTRGIELEPEARIDFERKNFQKVNQTGFVELDEWQGCSPDGLINKDGLLQIKCPAPNTMIMYHKKQNGSKKYYYQLQAEMYVTGRDYNIFYCYHPEIREYVEVVNRDEKTIKEMKDKIELAKIEVLARIEAISGK